MQLLDKEDRDGLVQMGVHLVTTAGRPRWESLRLRRVKAKALMTPIVEGEKQLRPHSIQTIVKAALVGDPLVTKPRCVPLEVVVGLDPSTSVVGALDGVGGAFLGGGGRRGGCRRA